MILVVVTFLIPICQRDKWNLDKSAFEISRMEDNQKIKNCQDCYNLTLQETLMMFNVTKFLIYTPDLRKGTSCRMYNFTFILTLTKQQVEMMPDNDVESFSYCFFSFKPQSIIS
jgi:hypothetical protein